VADADHRDKSVPIIVGAVAVAAMLSWVSWLAPLAYPFRLLLTLVHEFAHGLAALATGGEFHRIAIFADGSGLAYTSGGWRVLVIPAGYLGAAAFAGAVSTLGASPRAGRWTLGVIGVFVGAMSLRYGLPSLFSKEASGGALATFAGIALASVLFLLATRASARWVTFSVLLLAIQAGLGTFSDLTTLIGLSGTTGEATDAHAMAELTLLPPVLWASLWALAAIVMIVAAVRWGWSKGPE